MYTPLELEKIEFGNAFMGGYKKDDVDEVFNELCDDYETLYKENIANRDKIAALEGVVEKYKSMEDSLQNALLLAQTSSDAAVRAAQDKAQNITKEAEMKAQYIVKEAERDMKDMSQKKLDIERSIRVFAAKQISQLRTQIEILNGMISENASTQNSVSAHTDVEVIKAEDNMDMDAATKQLPKLDV